MAPYSLILTIWRAGVKVIARARSTSALPGLAHHVSPPSTVAVVHAACKMNGRSVRSPMACQPKILFLVTLASQANLHPFLNAGRTIFCFSGFLM